MHGAAHTPGLRVNTPARSTPEEGCKGIVSLPQWYHWYPGIILRDYRFSTIADIYDETGAGFHVFEP